MSGHEVNNFLSATMVFANFDTILSLELLAHKHYTQSEWENILEKPEPSALPFQKNVNCATSIDFQVNMSQ